MSRQRAVGTATETGIVRFLRGHGFPHAERRPLSGALDRGDILACPGIIIEAKSGNAAAVASDGQIQKWLNETERERVNANAVIGLLVTKRKGVSDSRAGDFWCHLDGGVFCDLIYERHDGTQYEPIGIPVRTQLAHVVELLRDAGYGDPR